MLVPSAANCTGAAVVESAEAAVTVAVKVTDCPRSEGVSEEYSPRSWVRHADHLPARERAVAGGEVGVAAVGRRDAWVPALKAESAMVALPPLKVAGTDARPVHRELHRAAVVEGARSGRHRGREGHRLAGNAGWAEDVLTAVVVPVSFLVDHMAAAERAVAGGEAGVAAVGRRDGVGAHAQ